MARLLGAHGDRLATAALAIGGAVAWLTNLPR
jgi:hypothetical protein